MLPVNLDETLDVAYFLFSKDALQSVKVQKTVSQDIVMMNGRMEM